MAVMNTSKPTLKDFLKKLRADYPDFNFKRGRREYWSPKNHTIFYDQKQPLTGVKFGILHELSHAILEHNNYSSDLELLKLESEAWHLAAKLGHKYNVKISENHIQNCLDTYRNWLHRRSKCPTCDMHVLQDSSSSYKCFNCGSSWDVSSGRFVRPYRMTHRGQ